MVFQWMESEENSKPIGYMCNSLKKKIEDDKMVVLVVKRILIKLNFIFSK